MAGQVELSTSRYAPVIGEMIANSTGAPVVTEHNVFQEARPANKPLISSIVRDLMMPGSRIVGMRHLQELHRLAMRRKACLILMEHYSNFDLPNFIDLLEQGGDAGREVADSVVAVAGLKLNEEGPLVLAFTEAYTRVVLYPSRGIESIADARQRHAAQLRRARINIAALKRLNTLRREGRLILVFPSGTRYRPWDPTTARGLREIDTYLKFYSYMVLVSINGNTLLPNPQGGMGDDFVNRDVMVYTAGPVMKCSDFRRRVLKEREETEDTKQQVADSVMEALREMHDRTEKVRERFLRDAGASGGEARRGGGSA